MRCLIKVTVPTEIGNAAIKEGSLFRKIESIVEQQKPEAAYFYEESGKRTFLIIMDIKDPSQIPGAAEPWFLAFNASVEFHPAMDVEDLKRAASNARYGEY